MQEQVANDFTYILYPLFFAFLSGIEYPFINQSLGCSPYTHERQVDGFGEPF